MRVNHKEPKKMPICPRNKACLCVVSCIFEMEWWFLVPYLGRLCLREAWVCSLRYYHDSQLPPLQDDDDPVEDFPMSKRWPGRKMRSETGIGGSGCLLSEMTSNVAKDAAVFVVLTTSIWLHECFWLASGFPSVAVAQRLRSSSSLAVVPEDGPQLKAHGTQRKVFFCTVLGEAYQESILRKISSSILLFFTAFSHVCSTYVVLIWFSKEVLSIRQKTSKRSTKKMWFHFGNCPRNCLIWQVM